MLQIAIQSSNDDKDHELFIDECSESVAFTVISKSEKLQIDFNLEEDEWERLKSFVDESMRYSRDYRKKHEKDNSPKE